MRAKEFITERNLFIIPELTSGDPYEIYRFGVALARARSENGMEDGVRAGQKRLDGQFSGESPFGENAIVVTPYEDGNVITQALGYSHIAGGKKSVPMSSGYATPPENNTSPMPGFKGYKRK
jgi:hypothetical protein